MSISVKIKTGNFTIEADRLITDQEIKKIVGTVEHLEPGMPLVLPEGVTLTWEDDRRKTCPFAIAASGMRVTCSTNCKLHTNNSCVFEALGVFLEGIG